MVLKTFRIEDLQPTDTLRQPVITSLDTLTSKEILDITPPPQVWNTLEFGLLISDGNNRVGLLANRNKKEVTLDYFNNNEVRLYCSGYIDIVLNRTKKIMNAGVYTPYDLWDI